MLGLDLDFFYALFPTFTVMTVHLVFQRHCATSPPVEIPAVTLGPFAYCILIYVISSGCVLA